MRALVYHGTKDVRYEEVSPPPGPGPQEVRLKVRYGGLCHTDYTEYLHGPLYISKTPHPRTGRSIPIVIGHEFSGEVVEVGTEVQRIAVGDCVAVNAVDCCRTCFYCRRGHCALCPTVAFLGFGRDGGFAEFALVPEACCHRLPAQVSAQAGVLVEPLSVALHAVKQARVEIGSRVAVVGGGTVGVCTLQALRAVGVRDVFVIERSEAKAGFSHQLGAAAVINPEKVNAAQAIAELTDGFGADLAFECVGSAPALRTAVDVTRAAGTVCIVGVFGGPIEFDFNTVLGKELKMVTSIAYGDEFPTVIAMLADGRLKADPMISQILPLAEALENGLHRFDVLARTNVRTLIEM